MCCAMYEVGVCESDGCHCLSCAETVPTDEHSDGFSTCSKLVEPRVRQVVSAPGNDVAQHRSKVWFKKACSVCGRVALGHNLDDQIETMLMRVSRCSGLHGLGGIPTRRPLAPLEGSFPVQLHSEGNLPVRDAPPAWADDRNPHTHHNMWGAVPQGSNPQSVGTFTEPVSIFRPLLEVPKAQLVATCAVHGLACVTDPTNATAAYDRNVVRHLLRDIGVGAVDAIGAARPVWDRAIIHQTRDGVAAPTGIDGGAVVHGDDGRVGSDGSTLVAGLTTFASSCIEKGCEDGRSVTNVASARPAEDRTGSGTDMDTSGTGLSRTDSASFAEDSELWEDLVQVSRTLQDLSAHVRMTTNTLAQVLTTSVEHNGLYAYTERRACGYGIFP